MVNILEALNDITKLDDNGVMADSLILVEGQSPSYFDEDVDNCYETDHDQRKKQLILSDPVHNIVLKDYLQQQVSFCCCVLVMLIFACSFQDESAKEPDWYGTISTVAAIVGV